MKRRNVLFCLAFALFAGRAVSQVPQLVNFQGRVTVGSLNFDGTGQFKFALVNSNGTVTFWSNDGTSSAGSQPVSAVSIPVSKGLYSVLLGNVTLPHMDLLPATVFTNTSLCLRVWFNDGANGFQLFAPDQRVAAVGYAIMAGNVPDGSISSAKLADGAVTLSKVGNDVKAGLGGTPSGGVMLTENPNATNLLASGFVKLKGPKVVTEEWESSLADTNMSFSGMAPPPIWTGTEAYLFRDSAMQGPLATRYNPASNTWHTLPTNNLPAFMDAKPVWLGNELMVLGGTPEGLQAARYRPASDNWQTVSTNAAPYFSSWESKIFWTGSELLVLGGSPDGWKGGRYRPATDTWLPISTNNAPRFSASDSRAVWTGTELIVLAANAEYSGRLYRPVTDTWLVVSTNGAPSNIGWDSETLWTGNSLMVLYSSPDGLRGARFAPASNTWTSATTNGAPNLWLTDARVVWSGTELVVFSDLTIQPRGARYSPATDTWRIPSSDMPRFGSGGAATPPDPIWTGTEMVIGFSFDQTMYPYAGGRYNPATDSWSGISQPADKPSGSASSFVWTGEQALVFAQDMSSMKWRLYKWTPSRTLYLYQKP